MKRGLFNCTRSHILPPILFKDTHALELTMTFKRSEEDALLKANHGGSNILDSFLLKLSDYSKNSTHIEVCSLKYPYKEFA
jgi:hypothetical protein